MNHKAKLNIKISGEAYLSWSAILKPYVNLIKIIIVSIIDRIPLETKNP